MAPRARDNARRGFSLLETIITIGILVIVAEVVYSWSLLIQRSSRDAQARTVASGIATEWIELIRNATYDDIGTTTGLPVGTFPSTQTVTRGDLTYRVDIAIDFVDDPFDGDALGTVPLKPVDTVPADYKRVEVSVCWNADCTNPVQLTTTVAPDGLETADDTGALFISVVDSVGLPVPLVDVRVTNTAVVPNIDITNKTDVNGKLQLLSLPPATDSYHIVVSKPGYSGDQTYPADAGNPNPVNPDTTVVAGGVTEVTLFVDRESTLAVRSERAGVCTSLGGVDFQLTGTELIGTNPEVLRYDEALATDPTGALTLAGMRWDTYQATLLTPAYDLAGADPPLPWVVQPDATMTPFLRLADHQPTTLLVTVRDSGTELPLTDASVRLEGNGFDETKVTNQGALMQTDWSGGSGQADFVDPTRYLSGSGALEVSVPGAATLSSQDAPFLATEDFSTTDNRDVGFTTADWTVGSPGSVTIPEDPATPGQYLGAATAQSVKLNAQEGRILDVTLTATETRNGETIDYFVAADGLQFEPVTPGVPHTFVSTGSDLRWRAVLSTATPTVTPVLNGVSLSYTQRLLDGTDATLTSSTFDTAVGSAFSTISWNPDTQPAGAGPDAFRVQIATNNDNATWNFVGPDGTATTYYTTSGETVSNVHDGDRYLRYRVSLHTDSPLDAPRLTDLSIVHSNSCQPPGQVFFSPLPLDGDYTLTVDRAGYSQFVLSVNVAGNDTETVLLSP